MIEVSRIVEYQASLSSYRATGDEERAVQLELLIELTKPKNLYSEWHNLIATPFRYSPPFKNARFRPPFTSSNVFYSALCDETAFYEYSFHFMKERLHLDIETETGLRTLFSVKANDAKAVRIHDHPNCRHIIHKNDYSHSHQFIKENSNIKMIVYPSCRDPKHQDNAAILDIDLLEKTISRETSLKYFYDNKKKQIAWLDNRLHIRWIEVN